MTHPLSRKIVVLGTGGTIAGTAVGVGDNIGYTAAQLGVAQLLGAIETLPALLGDRELRAEQVAQVDSKDMDFALWQQLAARCAHWLADDSVQGVVVTHGTDTLEETAYFLQAVLQPRKPVVMTCAMRPATALVPDGPQNMLDAMAVALDSGALGVVVVCAGVVHSAREVRKVHPYRLDAFDSGDVGPIGFVEEHSVRWVRGQALVPVEAPCPMLEKVATATSCPRVEIVMNHAGASGVVVDLLVKDGVHGLVAAGTGNGSLHHDLEAALLRAQSAGVRVVRASRCPLGRILPRPDDILADSQGLSPVKARVALILELLSFHAACSRNSSTISWKAPQKPGS